MTATKTATKKSRKAKAPDMVTLSSVYASVAAKRDVNTTDAAKGVRGRMRANFSDVCDLSPNIRDAKKAANDGNRWPTHVTRALADFLTK